MLPPNTMHCNKVLIVPQREKCWRASVNDLYVPDRTRDNNDVLRDFFPDLHQGINELWYSLWNLYRDITVTLAV